MSVRTIVAWLASVTQSVAGEFEHAKLVAIALYGLADVSHVLAVGGLQSLDLSGNLVDRIQKPWPEKSTIA